MQFNMFKIFSIFGVVSTWATKALADGKVSLAEAVELVTALCSILGVVAELAIPALDNPTIDPVLSNPGPLSDTASPATDDQPPRAPPADVSPKLAAITENG